MTHTALYRRFRPDNFDDVVGQDALVRTLKGQIISGRINHAYLFCGPRGIGKTTVARILAKSINCKSPENGNACGKCSACAALNNQNNFDIIEIDAASNNGVDNIRDLRENIKFMPAAGRYRVYIIDEVHMLSTNAFNALLKTLEEPPAHIVFIMATTEPDKLPVTVLSRCQRFDFNRVKAADISMLLKKVASEAGIKIDSKAVESISRASEGGVRDALSLLDQSSAFSEGEITQEHVYAILGSANRLMYFALADSILTQDTPRALSGFAKMLDEGCNTLSVARDLMGHFRDLFIAKNVKNITETLSIDDVMADRLKKQAANASEGVLIKCIDLFSSLESDLRYASSPRVFIELAIAKACRTESDASYANILERVERLEATLKNGIPVTSQIEETTQTDKKKDDSSVKRANAPEEKKESSKEVYPDEYIPLPELEEQEYFPYADEKPREEIPAKEKKEKKSNEERQQTIDIPPDEIKEKPTEKKVDKKVEPADEKQVTEFKKAWKTATEKLKQQKKMSIATAMKKAVPKSLNGDVFTVIYDANLTGLDRLEDRANMRIISETLAGILGKTVTIEIERKVLDDTEKGFLDDLSKFPKDLISKN
ncbi:MAG: DNA polymerase III subunit gamma/tau [Clostridia bacterium]|nr:DNA polymerase III subunit gamma/tau [Clostridia bacterium]